MRGKNHLQRPAGRRRKTREISVRRGGPRDLDAIDAIEAAGFTTDRFARRNLRRLLGSESAAALVAEGDGRPLGYVLLLLRRGAKAARLYSMATLPPARGRGVGKALVDAAAACAVKRGRERLRLEVRRTNAVARRLYERAGFSVIDERPGYYEDGETALLMEKRLRERADGR